MAWWIHDRLLTRWRVFLDHPADAATPRSPRAVPRWPEGRRFAVAVFDDTDNATVANVGPVYEVLDRLGMRSTKSVWVYPSRDRFGGQCLQDPPYLAWVRGLAARGFEIALHGVGSGPFTRVEIARGLERYHELLGAWPRLHANHAGNPDSLYWGAVRFSPPVSWAYRLLSGRRTVYTGHEPLSPHFWGDLAQRHIQYVRNYTFHDINTLRCDPRMPWRDPRKPLCNLWFSSSDAHTVDEFLALFAPPNLARLARRGGACIVYTHFASGFVRDDRLRDDVLETLERLAEAGGWAVPVGTLLDWLVAQGGGGTATRAYLAGLEGRWLRDRVRKRLRFGR